MRTKATRLDLYVRIRIPVEMKDLLFKLALENGRSLNSEILTRLKESMHTKTKSER